MKWVASGGFEAGFDLVGWLQFAEYLFNFLTFPSVLNKQCGVVSGMADRWHHPILITLAVSYSNWVLYSPGEISVK